MARLAHTHHYKQSSPFYRCRQPAQEPGDLEMMEPQDGRGLAGPLSNQELKCSPNELISAFVFPQPSAYLTIHSETRTWVLEAFCLYMWEFCQSPSKRTGFFCWEGFMISQSTWPTMGQSLLHHQPLRCDSRPLWEAFIWGTASHTSGTLFNAFQLALREKQAPMSEGIPCR